jgi:hypothetical protein
MTEETILDLLERSDWVIRGTVRKTRATSTPEVAASEHTSVVRVDEVLHGPAQFSDHVGRDITLYSEDAGGLGARRQAVFFTRSWLYGRSLGVIEVGRIVRKGGKTLTDDVRRAEEAAFDRRLGERIARANLVVAGEVVDQGSGPELERPIESEHVPDWAQVYVRVSDVLKGKKPNEIVPVVYPRSNDELWIDSPKLIRGVVGVLILQENQQEKGWPVLRVPGLTALDPLDLQPIDMLDRIRRIIEAGGNK